MQHTYPVNPPQQVPMQRRGLNQRWLLIGGAVGLSLFLMACMAIFAAVAIYYASGRILPGVSVVGIPVRGYTIEDAATLLQSEWSQITIRDGDRAWAVPAAELGIMLDAEATAFAAQQVGRTVGSPIAALLGRGYVEPVLNIDAQKLTEGIKAFAPNADLPARNATIRMVDGELMAVPAEEGRLIDVDATINNLLARAGEELADGSLDLTMNTTLPAVTDATPLLEQTRALLTSPLTIDAYDPIQNQSMAWSVAPDQWGQWLTTANTDTGISLSLDGAALGNYLNSQQGSLGESRYIDIEETVKSLQNAVSGGKAQAQIRVRHTPTKHTVSPGETLGSISWTYGITMWRIQNANPGVNLDSLSVGQVITIPSKDDMLPLPIIPNKRIVVSISEQTVRVYENGGLKWDWAGSTGIADSPTMPGVFQVLSHDGTAYAGNWNLWMPSFMGIYEAVPGFTNGFHGFPSRGGSQILWENALGRRVTYGCILVSSANAELLYHWAEDGVVVEIQR